MQKQLKNATKVFSTVDQMCYHMCVCWLTKIITNLAMQKGEVGAAWKLADNFIVLNTRANIPVSMTAIENAITLAQKH
eukprot:3616390-Rhodomonas_salina.1